MHKRPIAKIWKTVLCNGETGKRVVVYALNPMPRRELPSGYEKTEETADDYYLPEGYSVQAIRGDMKITDANHAECKISDGYYVAHPALIPPAWQASGMAYPLTKIKKQGEPI